MDENGLVDWDHLERETVIDAAATKTFERLYALVKKGYRPEFQESFPGANPLTIPCTPPSSRSALPRSGVLWRVGLARSSRALAPTALRGHGARHTCALRDAAIKLGSEPD